MILAVKKPIELPPRPHIQICSFLVIPDPDSGPVKSGIVAPLKQTYLVLAPVLAAIVVGPELLLDDDDRLAGGGGGGQRGRRRRRGHFHL